MPAGDRTGNRGLGSKTGRGLGYCSGSDTPGYASDGGGGEAFRRGAGAGSGAGRGMGRRDGSGRGAGLGRGRTGFTGSDEKEFLKDQAEHYKKELESINSRLNELEK